MVTLYRSRFQVQQDRQPRDVPERASYEIRTWAKDRLTGLDKRQAAVVAISGTATEFTGPQAFRINTYGKGVCYLEEETDTIFPNPGDQVFFADGYSADTPSVRRKQTKRDDLRDARGRRLTAITRCRMPPNARTGIIRKWFALSPTTATSVN